MIGNPVQVTGLVGIDPAGDEVVGRSQSVCADGRDALPQDDE